MGVVVVEPPQVQPVTVAEAKAFFRFPHDDEDALIAELIEAATESVEQQCGRVFVQRVMQATFRHFPVGDVIRLRPAPLLEVESVSYRNPDGDVIFLDEGVDFLVDKSETLSEVLPLRSWPRTGDFPDAITISFIAGYPSDGGSPEDLTARIPAKAKAAIKALASHWFEQREPVAFAAAHEVPFHVRRLCNQLKVWR